jgi:cell division protein FtsW
LLLALQMMFHFAVNLGLVPTKGLTLPLMSYGGSSMLMSCLAVGLLLSVDRSLPPSRVGAAR